MVFKQCLIGTKVCQENSPHTITPPPAAWTVETRQDGSMLSCSLCQILTRPYECHSRNQDFPIFYGPVLVSLCELCPPCAVLIWPERHPVWSSAAGAHLLQGSTCCVFRDVFCRPWLVIWVTVVFLSSLTSPFSSDLNKAFSFSLTGYFLFFGPFSVNPRDGNPSRSAVCEILRPTTIPHSKSLKSPFFPILMLGLSHLHHI